MDPTYPDPGQAGMPAGRMEAVHLTGTHGAGQHQAGHVPPLRIQQQQDGEVNPSKPQINQRNDANQPG